MARSSSAQPLALSELGTPICDVSLRWVAHAWADMALPASAWSHSSHLIPLLHPPGTGISTQIMPPGRWRLDHLLPPAPSCLCKFSGTASGGSGKRRLADGSWDAQHHRQAPKTPLAAATRLPDYFHRHAPSDGLCLRVIESRPHKNFPGSTSFQEYGTFFENS